MALVARYKKRFPGTSIWVEFGNSGVMAKKVLNYELDLAVTAREYVLPSFHSLAFSSHSLIVMAQKGSGWEAGVNQDSHQGTISSHDEIVCMAERRASQLIAGFFAIAQEFVDERASNRRAAREAEVPWKPTQPGVLR